MTPFSQEQIQMGTDPIWNRAHICLRLHCNGSISDRVYTGTEPQPGPAPF